MRFILQSINGICSHGKSLYSKHCLSDWYSDGKDSLGPTQQAVIQVVKGADANTTTGEGTFTFFQHHQRMYLKC